MIREKSVSAKMVLLIRGLASFLSSVSVALTPLRKAGTGNLRSAFMSSSATCLRKASVVCLPANNPYCGYLGNNLVAKSDLFTEMLKLLS